MWFEDILQMYNNFDVETRAVWCDVMLLGSRLEGRLGHGSTWSPIVERIRSCSQILSEPDRYSERSQELSDVAAIFRGIEANRVEELERIANGQTASDIGLTDSEFTLLKRVVGTKFFAVMGEQLELLAEKARSNYASKIPRSGSIKDLMSQASGSAN